MVDVFMTNLKGRGARDQAMVLVALAALAPGLTPRSVLEKFTSMQMIDVIVPTTDGRELQLTRTTKPEPDLKLLLDKLRLELPAQPPPRITVAAPPAPAPV